jgi:hypothetical protein
VTFHGRLPPVALLSLAARQSAQLLDQQPVVSVVMHQEAQNGQPDQQGRQQQPQIRIGATAVRPVMNAEPVPAVRTGR